MRKVETQKLRKLQEIIQAWKCLQDINAGQSLTSLVPHDVIYICTVIESKTCKQINSYNKKGVADRL